MREVLLVDGRVAEGRGGHTGGGDAGYLGAALQRAGEVRHCSCGVVQLLRSKAPGIELAACKTLAKWAAPG